MSLASQAARLAGLELVEVASVPKSKRTRPRLPVPEHAAKKAVLMNFRARSICNSMPWPSMMASL